MNRSSEYVVLFSYGTLQECRTTSACRWCLLRG